LKIYFIAISIAKAKKQIEEQETELSRYLAEMKRRKQERQMKNALNKKTFND
jgi:hypothetical protein